MTEEEQALFGIDKLNVVALDDPGGDACRLLGARPDGALARPTRATTRCSAPSRQRTGCPVLVNTSFNVRGEPIVCTPEDAFRCFMGTEIEVLVAANCYLRQGTPETPRSRRDYKDRFELD